MADETFSLPDGTLNHRFVPRDGAWWCDYHLGVGETCGYAIDRHPLGSIVNRPTPVGPGKLTLTDGSVIEIGSGYATLSPTPRTEHFEFTLPALGVDTSELVDALLGVVHSPPPARVKVKPRGHVNQGSGYGPFLFCRAGFKVTCTECGPLPYPSRFGTAECWLDKALDRIARPHLQEKHS